MLDFFTNTKRTFFDFFTKGDNRIARLADLNNLVNSINRGANFTNFDIKLTQSGTSAPARYYMTAGSTDNCKSNCPSDCFICACSNCLNEVSGSSLKTNSIAISFAYNDIGIYTMTITPGSDFGSFLGISTFLSPVAAANSTIAMTPFATADGGVTYTSTIRTQSAAGVLANGILNNIFMNLRFYRSIPKI